MNMSEEQQVQKRKYMRRKKNSEIESHEDISGSDELENKADEKVPKSQKKKPRVPKELTAKDRQLVRDMSVVYASIGMMISSINQRDGFYIMSEAPKRAEELVRFARHHKSLYDMLAGMIETGDTMTFLVGHGMMIYTLLSMHGLVPAIPFAIREFTTEHEHDEQNNAQPVAANHET